MKIAVIGAGGIGGYFGGKLAHAGEEVTFVVRGATLAALRRDGLEVESIQGDFTLPRVQATDDIASIGPVDAVLIAVKAWQVAEVAPGLAPLLGAETAVLPLENGIDAPDILAAAIGSKHVLGGLCAIVSFIVEPGHVRHAAYEPIVMFGELDNRPSRRVEALREAFVRAGVKAEIPADIRHSMWAKLLFIAPMSGFGAITRVPVGQWRALPEVRESVTRCLEEITAVAAAQGVDLGEDAVPRTLERFDAMDPASTASLQRDVMAGRPSELDAQLGAIVRLGRESGVATPVTSMLYHWLLPQERVARQNPG